MLITSTWSRRTSWVYLKSITKGKDVLSTLGSAALVESCVGLVFFLPENTTGLLIWVSWRIYIYVFFFFPLHQWFIPHDMPFSFTVKKAVFVALSSPVPEERIKSLSHSRDTCLLQVLLSLGSLTCNPAASGSISVCCFILNTTGKEEVSLFLICSVFVGLLFLC